jgi:GNAT superfamily N-acetyltransferase
MVAEANDVMPEPYLWRLLIDRRHQRRGIATQVIAQLCARCRDMGHGTLMTSWSLGPGTPQPFYLRLGFVPTGELLDDEIEARLVL